MNVLKLIKIDYKARGIVRQLEKHQTTSIEIKKRKEKPHSEKE